MKTLFTKFLSARWSFSERANALRNILEMSGAGEHIDIVREDGNERYSDPLRNHRGYNCAIGPDKNKEGDIHL